MTAWSGARLAMSPVGSTGIRRGVHELTLPLGPMDDGLDLFVVLAGQPADLLQEGARPSVRPTPG